MSGVLYGLACAVVGGVIGWKLCWLAWGKANKEMARRFAVVLKSHSIPVSNVRKIMEVGYGDIETLYQVANEIQGRVRREAEGRASQGTVEPGPVGNQRGKD